MARAPRDRRSSSTITSEADILYDAEQAARAGDALGVLSQASELIAALDPDRDRPLRRVQRNPEETPRLVDLIAALTVIDHPGAVSVLAGLRHLTPDEVTAERLRRHLDQRDIPPALRHLDQVDTYRAIQLTHDLGDGDNIVIGSRLANGQVFTTVVYVDHNLGTLVKDAFVVPDEITKLVGFMQDRLDDPAITVAELDPADARARISRAIDSGRITVPPIETDTWPACRPLVEWLCRSLPQGGRGYHRPDWPASHRAALIDRFASSLHANDLGATDVELMAPLLAFAIDHGPGDPLRWSPVSVEILLTEWLPRRVSAPEDQLEQLPRLLRAFVRFAHHERGIRPGLTRDTLDAIDRCESEYRALIGSAGTIDLSLLSKLIGVDDLAAESVSVDESSFGDLMLDTLARAVGGLDALRSLDDEPLPDEPFQWAGIPEDIADRVAEVLDLCDRCADELFDSEVRTALRRMLARVACGDPAVFRRRARAETAAAALCWIIGNANDLFGPGCYVKDIVAYFGLGPSAAPSQRAEVMLRAAGINPRQYGGLDLGSPELLVASRRRMIIERRDRHQAD